MADPSSRQGERYATQEILSYVNQLHAAHDGALERAFSAPEREGLPPIQVGPSEGKLLTLLLRLISPKKVVEVGTLAGYSALRLAKGLAPGGTVWTIEFDPRHAQVARTNVEAAGEGKRIKVLEGEAAKVLPTLEKEGPFDAVFIDADKANYDVYGRWAARNLRQGGLLIADNAYLFGRLMERGAEAEAVRRFHEEAAEAFDAVCIPTPDGLLLGIRR